MIGGNQKLKAWSFQLPGILVSTDFGRFVPHSNQLDKPIHFPFMAADRLTSERILAEFERVIQSNQEFRLNDTVEINLIHVSMPVSGKGNKRSEVNLKKHLKKKKSIIRIQNEDDLCMARALVVAKAKLENDPCDRHIRMSYRLLQTRLAQELHQNAGVPLGPCGIDQAKLFQVYLTEHKSISCRKSTTITSSTLVLRKTKRFTSTCTTIIMTSSPRCLDSLAAATIATPARKPMIITKNTCVRTNASFADFLPFVLRSPGKLAKTAIDSSRANGVTRSINGLEAMPDPSAKV